MAKTNKGKKKLSTRMKKAIRRTLGGLLMVTALVVALVPEKEMGAANGTPQITVSATDSSIPVIDSEDTIYSTGDGMFQFAYVEKGSGGDKVAVIVGYDYERSLDGGVLTIPNTADAYVKYTHAQGTAGGYVAVGKSGNVLYYPVYKDIEVDTGEVDEEGNPIYETQQELDYYAPCLYSTYDSWYYNGDKERKPEEFYYESSSGVYTATTDEIYQRIQNATVAYISSQHVVKSGDSWVLDETPNVGIFSKATNITTLKTGGDLLGIGDYAFYECASLRGIELGDGANTIGNYAFANCVNLQYASFPTNSSIRAIGDHAFYNCRSLQKFTMPVAVKKVGDSAFEGCAGMTEIDLNAGGQQVMLTEVGPDVFKNCTGLQQLIFPEYYNQTFDIAWLEGCTSLNYVRVPNVDMEIVANEDFSFADFMAQVPQEFYFEGADYSKMHEISKANSFAFKYLKEEIYEKVLNAKGGDEGTGQSVFRVNNNNELIYFYMDDTVQQINIPGKIGPYRITVIGSDSFQANHNLTKITIPNTITEIQANAFKGCHRLEDVIFESPISVTTIGDSAFDTQVIDPILDTCTLSDVPKLTFTGEAVDGSAPFEYAMNPANNVNAGSQKTTFITFYTGWPSNLTIQYNSLTDKNELIDYPRLTELASYSTSNYPYITTENALAASKAYAAYLNGDTMTQDQKDIIGSALNVNIPSGVEAIKEGIFSNKDAYGNTVDADSSANTDISTITLTGISKIDPYTFAGCSNLIGAYINSDTESLGDYAFQDCNRLADVDIYSDLTEFGTRPFAGCEDLSHVDFGSNPNFQCFDAIIYGMRDGEKYSILEVLESRGLTYGIGTISTNELSGIKELAKEAFMDCDGVVSVDLSASNVAELPENVFAETDDLYSVVLPDGIRRIAKDAFRNSNIRYLDIPNSLSVIDSEAFNGDLQTITFYCEEDSAAADYASNYKNIIVSSKPVTYKVTYYDEDGVTILDEVSVNAGEDAVTYIEIPVKEGYVFDCWFPAPVGVTENMKTYAKYVPEEVITYTVQFINWDDSVWDEQEVVAGGSAELPLNPSRENYTFMGWKGEYTNVNADTKVYAYFEKMDPVEDPSEDPSESPSSSEVPSERPSASEEPASSEVPSESEKPSESETPSESVKPSESEKPSGSEKPNSSETPGNTTTTPTTPKLYNLMVIDGNGSGSYVSGATVILLADNPPSGKVFDQWVCEDASVTFTGKTLAASTITMPAADVTVTATYKADPNASTGGSSNNNNSSGGTTTIIKPNTTVTIDKDGIPNESTASASVSGSTDNFVLKVTESAYAESEVKEALEEAYGDIDDIRYFAMDISLYDSTGSKKVENTDSLKVTVTLPIPEALVPYAGNNKVAYVVNGKLVNLSPKFTTINGVPCITFVAPHFSPYVIYADTSNLSAGTILDTTPQTGDGIAPKWFLCIGLVAVAMFLFLKQDKKTVKIKA